MLNVLKSIGKKGTKKKKISYRHGKKNYHAFHLNDKSVLSSELIIDLNDWSISLIRDANCLERDDKTCILLETRGSSNQHPFKAEDYLIYLEKNSVHSKNAMVVIKKIERKHKDNHEHLLNHLPLGKIIGETWSITSDMGGAFLAHMRELQKAKIPFDIKGADKLLNHGHNNYTWAREQLLKLDVDEINEALTEKSFSEKMNNLFVKFKNLFNGSLDLNQKKELVLTYFKSILNTKSNTDIKTDEIELLKNKIIKNLSTKEIEGVLNICYDDLFYIKEGIYIAPFDHPVAQAMTYLYDENRKKLFYNELSQSSGLKNEVQEIEIKNIENFQEKLKALNFSTDPVNLSYNEFNELIFANTYHKPCRPINQIDASTFISYSKELISAIYEKELNKAFLQALTLTILSSVIIITLPFLKQIFNSLFNKLNQENELTIEYVEESNLVKSIQDLKYEPIEADYCRKKKFMLTNPHSMRDVVYDDREKCEYINKINIFDKQGNFKKMFTSFSNVWQWDTDADEEPILAPMHPTLISKDKCFRMFCNNDEKKEKSKEQSKNKIDDIKRSLK